jgi:hypothetical protein
MEVKMEGRFKSAVGIIEGRCKRTVGTKGKY